MSYKFKNYLETIFLGMIIIFLGWLIATAISNEVNRPTEGKIIAKKYEPAHTEVEWEKVKEKDHETKVPVTRYEGEKYIVTIKGINKKGNEVSYSFYVTEEEYEKLQIGDSYILEQR